MDNYQLLIRDTSGNHLATVFDFNWLTLDRQLNAAGLLTFNLPPASPAIAQLTSRGVVELQRKPASASSWYVEFRGLFLGGLWEYKDSSLSNVAGESYTAYCPGLLWLLSSRVVAWAAGATNRSQFTSVAAETIAKTLVTYNAGSAALASNSRLIDGVIPNLTIDSDLGRGSALDWICHGENLLGSLQRLGSAAAADFDLNYSSGVYSFQWYPGHRGSDRSTTVYFALERSNMRRPAYVLDHRLEKQTAIANGTVSGSAAYRVRTGSDYVYQSDDSETWLKTTGTQTAASLDSLADAVLGNSQVKQSLDFEMISQAGCVYGTDYFLGDLVTATYRGVSFTQKINRLKLNLDSQGQRLQVLSATV